ncbi:MAG: glycoside hydrolase family 140 protein [Planctomycetota bacterium]
MRCTFSMIAALAVAAAAPAAEPWLRVSDNGRYLQRADGQPFFYLGDTAWELFHRLDRDEADVYLRDRAAKGFTVIQAVALAELDGLRTPNPYGHTPLVDLDPSRPDTRPGEHNDYWDHVDFIVDRAAELGLTVALLPTWGDKWVKRWGVGPEVFTPENAAPYGEWLGRRYGDKPVIWVLGGDRNPDSPERLAIIRAMAAGLARGDGGRNLMTFHPQGRSNSATWFHDDDWLDFHLIQSGHERPAAPGYELIRANFVRRPLKPTIDGEPCYEDHPHKGPAWERRAEPGAYLPWFDEYDARVAAYGAMLAGACGHAYGDHNLWQMWQPGREPISIARTAWRDALNHPGARQMGYLRGLFEARPYWQLRPAQEMIGGPGVAVRAAAAEDGSFAVVYLPEGGPVTVDASRLTGELLLASWFNPRQNATQPIGRFVRDEAMKFKAPFAGRNNDWVLVLDDPAAQLPPIGCSHR